MRRSVKTFAFIALSFFILTANTCLAADYSEGILDQNKVYKISKSVSSETYPNSDDILVDDYIIESYNPDGTSTIWDDTFLKVLTKKGKRSNKTLSFYYTLPYSTVELPLLEIIKPDGSVQNIDVPKQSRVMINDSQMIANIYDPNSKILRVNIPDLQVNDIIRYVSLRKVTKPRMPDTWSDYSLFESTTPIKHLTLEIVAPSNLPIKKISLLDEVKDTVSYTSSNESKTTVHKWEAKDVPRMFPEPNMPPLSSVVQRLLTSTVADWQTISRWYWDLCLPHLETTTPEMKEKVDELIKGKNTDPEKAKAIYHYVSQQIRYMGITTEKDAPGYEPHDVKITFENKYGVCRDKAALLVSMLRLASIKSFPVLVKVGPKMDKEVPMIGFNHAIACAELTPDHYTLMDPTDESSKHLLPPYLCNKSYLVAKPKGETLKTTPIILADENLMRITTNGQLNSAGKLTAKVQLNFDGINDNAYRGFFARLTPENRRVFFEKTLRNLVPSAKLTNLTITPKNMHDISKPLAVKLEYEAENMFIQSGQNRTAMLSLPWFGKAIGIINHVIGEAGLKKRKYPLKTNTTCGYDEHLDIKFDSEGLGFESIPAYKQVNTDTITYKQNLSYNKKTLKGTSKLLLKVVEFSPKQYLVLKRTLKDLEINQKKLPILSLPNKSTGIPNTVSETNTKIIKTQTEIVLEDEHSWTKKHYTKMKILNYPGKKENSEIKISYNPIWESVKIDKAIVTGTDGRKQTFSKEEMNVMDAPWTGSAPRYPAEKMLVLNLPGVEVGSIIEIQATSHTKDKPFFSDIVTFRNNSPTMEFSYQISVPLEVALKITQKNLDGITEKRTESSEHITYEWKSTNQKALKKETALPPSWTFLPTIILSTGNWGTYFNQLNTHLTKASKVQPKIKDLTEKLTTTQNKIDEKIIAIRDFVAKNIRSAGPTFTKMPLTSISPALDTLSDGYGNSADQAVLLYSLLKAANLDPTFVLTSNYPAELKQLTNPMLETPQKSLFSKILVAVRTGKGNTIYLNDTNEYSALGTTTNEGNLGLDLSTGNPTTIKPLKNKSNEVVFDYQIELDNNGNAILSITKKFFGNSFGTFNKLFSEQTPEERDRYYQSSVAEISQSATAINKLVTNFQNYPGMEQFSVKMNNYGIIEGDYYYFKTPFFLNSLFDLGKDKRLYPYYQGKRINSIYNIDVRLPEDFTKKIIVPRRKDIALPNNSGKIGFSLPSAKRTAPHWTEKVQIKSQPSIFSPEHYDEILKINKQISSPAMRTILLKK